LQHNVRFDAINPVALDKKFLEENAISCSKIQNDRPRRWNDGANLPKHRVCVAWGAAHCLKETMTLVAVHRSLYTLPTPTW
jgi:hypothetical protein